VGCDGFEEKSEVKEDVADSPSGDVLEVMVLTSLGAPLIAPVLMSEGKENICMERLVINKK